MGNEIDQKAVVRHVVLQVRMRPVGSPQDAVGEALNNAPGERYDVAVSRALAMESRRPGYAQTLWASDLAPDVVVLAHEFHDQFEFGTVDGFRHIGPAH